MHTEESPTINFAEDAMELEYSLMQEFTEEKLTALIQLYSSAVE